LGARFSTSGREGKWCERENLTDARRGRRVQRRPPAPDAGRRRSPVVAGRERESAGRACGGARRGGLAAAAAGAAGARGPGGKLRRRRGLRGRGGAGPASGSGGGCGCGVAG